MARPTTLESYIGQEHIKPQLRMAIDATLRRRGVLQHVILHGPPGLGKTTLAYIISTQLRGRLHETVGNNLRVPSDVQDMLKTLRRGDFLFIDEIHRIPSRVEEVLYPALEDFKLHVSVQRGRGNSKRSILRTIPLPPFTVIGATTSLSGINKPLRDRFPINYNLEYYDAEELAQIVVGAARRDGIDITEAAAIMIGRRSHGTARTAINLLSRIIDLMYSVGKTHITNSEVEAGCMAMGIDDLGLGRMHRRILLRLRDQFGGGPVGWQTLTTAIGTADFPAIYEPQLITLGMIDVTSRGRILTDAGRKHISKMRDLGK
jgi:holliday junction DNA helicase RuvB